MKQSYNKRQQAKLIQTQCLHKLRFQHTKSYKYTLTHIYQAEKKYPIVWFVFVILIIKQNNNNTLFAAEYIKIQVLHLQKKTTIYNYNYNSREYPKYVNKTKNNK